MARFRPVLLLRIAVERADLVRYRADPMSRPPFFAQPRQEVFDINDAELSKLPLPRILEELR